MDEMMLVQHVDILSALRQGQGFVRARANCRACACAGICRDWLLQGSATEAHFCPNLDFFAALKRRDEQG